MTAHVACASAATRCRPWSSSTRRAQWCRRGGLPTIQTCRPEVSSGWSFPGTASTSSRPRRTLADVAHGGAHGLSIDPKGNVWAGTHSTEGGGRTKVFSSLAKFTRDGTLLIQKGKHGQSKGNADTDNFAQPTQVAFDPETNEAFVSDGYNNRRVIVLDADTMAFKRMWGAYGKPPSDEPMAQRKPGDPPPPQFGLVHCIKMSPRRAVVRLRHVEPPLSGIPQGRHLREGGVPVGHGRHGVGR